MKHFYIGAGIAHIPHQQVDLKAGKLFKNPRNSDVQMSDSYKIFRI